MKFEIKKFEMSKSIHLKNLRLPERPSPKLAYFCGVLAGDGHISIKFSKMNFYKYKMHCAGNAKDEVEFYNKIINPLIKELFRIDLTPRHFDSNTFGIQTRCKALVEYLTDVLKLPKNRKYDQLKIPNWIKTDKILVSNYICGLADTDFCLTLKRRYKKEQYYPVITGASNSKKFIEEIADELESLGILVSRSLDITRKDPRFKSGFDTTHRLHIYGPSQVVKWMKIIGFSSPKHLEKLELWKIRNKDNNRRKVIAAIKELKENEVAIATPV